MEKTYEIRVFTGAPAVREVADRVNNMAGLLARRASAGTEHVTFCVTAADAVGACVKVRELLTYQGLASFSRPLCSPRGVMVRETVCV